MWIDKLIELLKASLPIIMPAISALGAVWLTNKFNRQQWQDNRKYEIEKAVEITKKENLEKLVVAYNKILEIDGGKLMYSRVGGPINEFNIDVYEKEIRPILYGVFHLHNMNVSKIMQDMDWILRSCEYEEEMRYEDHDVLISKYRMLIELITNYLKNYREKLL